MVMLENEIRTTPTITTLFRSNTICTEIVAQLMRLIGRPYLRATFGTALELINNEQWRIVVGGVGVVGPVVRAGFCHRRLARAYIIVTVVGTLPIPRFARSARFETD